jgi:plasmid rolling circle replication initiator protein Rep
VKNDNDRHLDKLARRVDREVERINVHNARVFINRIRNKEQEQALAREQAKADREFSIYKAAEIEYAHDPITEVPEQVKLTSWVISEIAHKVEYNLKYAEHYMQRYIDTNLKKYLSLFERVQNCHRSWFGDHYRKSGVFNVKRVFHCHNRWCWLCTHLEQAKRLFNFTTKFESLSEDYDLYHVVFTVPNVYGDELKVCMDRMHKSFKQIVRYFQGFKNVSGIDFTQYGFAGAVRSFEIVIHPFDYHPHIHALFLLKKDIRLVKSEVNKYSFSNGRMDRMFSDLEVLLQKIFFLAYNGQRVNLENISAVPLGYSCIVDLVEGDAWHEVFKYATKMSKTGASVCTYKQFCLLDDILCRRKMIQGYGILECVDGNVEADPTAEILFEKILIMLSKTETPERDVRFVLDKIVTDLHNKNMTVISKKMSYAYLESIKDALKSELDVEDGFEPF